MNGILPALLLADKIALHTPMTVRHRVRCPHGGEAKILDREYHYRGFCQEEERIVVHLSDGKKDIRVPVDLIIAVEGMAMVRYGALWGLTLDGNRVRSGKKRGRPSKKVKDDRHWHMG